jgi:hypothetical protein
MRFVLRLFGIPVLSLDMLELVAVEEEDKDSRIEAGSAHNFERDVFPLSPTQHHEWEWEDKKGFGFR